MWNSLAKSTEWIFLVVAGLLTGWILKRLMTSRSDPLPRAVNRVMQTPTTTVSPTFNLSQELRRPEEPKQEPPAVVSVPADMKTQDVVASLCRLAADRKLENRSEIALLRRSGYSAATPLSEGAFESYLRVHPELVESWLDYSADICYTPAWGLFGPPPWEAAPTEWMVGRSPDDARYTFPDKYKACAFFLGQFVRELAENADRVANRRGC
jgi:hypothetical protein